MATLDFSITVPNSAAALQDFTDYHGWTATVLTSDGQTIPNPLTRQQFAKNKVADFIRESIKAQRVRTAIEGARQTAADAVDAMNIS